MSTSTEQLHILLCPILKLPNWPRIKTTFEEARADGLETILITSTGIVENANRSLRWIRSVALHSDKLGILDQQL